MRQFILTAFRVLGFLLLSAGGMAQGVKSKVKMPSCEAVCAGLAEAIRRDPSKLVFRLEDALVINETCTADIVTTAIDAVSADPPQVQKIVETAMNVVPHRAKQVHLAVTNFSVPAAVAAVQPVFEVRRAELPDGQVPVAFEVRRAEAPDGAHRPLEEVRKAIVGELAEEVRPALLADMLKDVPVATPWKGRSRK